MRTTLSWLQEYVDISAHSPEAIAAALTSVGLEVEGLTRSAAFGTDVVVGHVVTRVKHPNADSLSLCTVDVGDGGEHLPIVCGAPNARAGIRVAVAKVGATLPGDFKIKKSKIRGETSCGMLCSGRELGISEESDGILELAADAPLGMPVVQWMGLADAILEVNVTPNRADCFGALGLARDLAAKLGLPLKMPEAKALAPQTDMPPVTVQIDDELGCRRFIALPVAQVAVVPSPKWMADRLEACGVRPINLLVDATNYAMLEFGQPVHAYDAKRVSHRTLKVITAKDGDLLETLDGQKRALAAGDLLIADAQETLGLAGIMGGASSEVHDGTESIIIEVASFDGRRIRRTARRLGMHTEASHRFERGTDAEVLVDVAYRVVDLIGKGLAAAGKPAPIVGNLVDVRPQPPSERRVALRLSFLRQMLAMPKISIEEASKHLVALGFRLLDHNADRMVFAIPSHRADIEREVDLVEEVGRLIGFDAIPLQLPTMCIRPTPEDPFLDFQEAVRVTMAQAGYRETISFPFDAEAEMKALGLSPGHALYPQLSLANPLSDHNAMLHASLIPGLLRATANSRRRGVRGSRLFECGRAFLAAGNKASSPDSMWKDWWRESRHYPRRARIESRAPRPEGLRPIERTIVAAVLDQPFTERTWHGAEAPAGFFHVKASLIQLCKALGTPRVQLARIKPEDLPFLHPGAAAVVMIDRKCAGWFGELHPSAAMELGWDVEHPPVLLELDLERLFEGRDKGATLAFESLRFPPVARDVAFLADQSLTHADVERCVSQFKQKRHLRGVRLFDIYVGDRLPAGKKSMAYSFSFQSPEKTLTDDAVEQELTALTTWLQQSLGIVQR